MEVTNFDALKGAGAFKSNSQTTSPAGSLSCWGVSESSVSGVNNTSILMGSSADANETGTVSMGLRYAVLADLFCLNSDLVFKKIGRGATAAVYKIEKKDIEEAYVIKVARRGDYLSEQQAKEIMVREIALLQTLSHVNVIPMLHAFEYENLPAFMMPCADDDLYEVIDRSKVSMEMIPEAEIHSLLNSLIDGLSYLHGNNIVHTDLKPDNILKFQSVWKIGDLGFAKKGECIRHLRYGMPQYWAPEVFSNKQYSKASDRWALGVILFEACACPFAIPYFRDTDSTGQIVRPYYFVETFLDDLHHVPVGYKNLCGIPFKKIFKKRVRKYCGTIESLYDLRGIPIEQNIHNLPRLHDRIMACALRLLRENPNYRLTLDKLKAVIAS